MKKILIAVVVGIVLGAVLTGIFANWVGKLGTGGAKKVSYAGVEYALDKEKVFENQIGPSVSYKVTYPRDFERLSLESASGSGFLNKFPTKIALPEDAFRDEHTNYGGAWLTLDYDNTKSEKNCYAALDGSGQQITETATVGTNTFHVARAGDAGAGNLYSSTIYRMMMNGGCFEAVTTLHTSNIGNYDPGTVKEFDKTKTDTMLKKVLETVTFVQK
jgi:hypothetical protein